MGAVSIPSLGGITDGAKAAVKNLQNKDVLFGLAAGILGAAAARIGANKLDEKLKASGKTGLPGWAATAAPLAGGVLGAAALYATKKGGSVGQTVALGVGAGLAGWALLRDKWVDKTGTPVLADIVSLQLGSYGVAIDEATPGLHGTIIDEPQRQLSAYADNPALADVYAASLGDEYDDFQSFIS